MASLTMDDLLFVDTETRSELDLKAVGTAEYARNCELLLISYKIGNSGKAEVIDMTNLDHDEAKFFAFRRRCKEHYERGGTFVAHGVMFDRGALTYAVNVAGMNIIPWDAKWIDTSTVCLRLGLPRGLDAATQVLGVPKDQQKMKEGKAGIALFCKPQPKNRKVRWHNSRSKPREWEVFKQYSGQDTDTLAWLAQKLDVCRVMESLPPFERELEIVDRKINDRGVYLDVPLAEAIIATVEEAKENVNAQISELTNGVVNTATQSVAMKNYLKEFCDLELDGVSATTVANTLKEENLHPVAEKLLRLRQQASQSSVAKYEKMIAYANADNRIRNTLILHGAIRTGRQAGSGPQLQNLVRQRKDFIARLDQTLAGFSAGCAGMIYDNPIEEAAQAVRSVLCAAPGYSLVIADASQIESRVLSWVANETWKLKAYSEIDSGGGYDAYVLTYSRCFGVHPSNVTPEQRAVGKVLELACGYQGWVGAFESMASVYNVKVDEDQAIRVIKAWREAHPQIVAFWGEIEAAAFNVIGRGNAVIRCGLVTVLNRVYEDEASERQSCMYIVLPSGRALAYPNMQTYYDASRDKMGLRFTSFKGANSFWDYTYGGSLTENVVQAIARDIFMHTLIECENRGYNPVFHVHDEAVNEVPTAVAESVLAEVEGLLSTPPPFVMHTGRHLPLAAEGFVSVRFRKSA